MTTDQTSSWMQPDEEAMNALRAEEQQHEANLRSIRATDQDAFRQECDRHMDRLVKIFRELIDRRK